MEQDILIVLSRKDQPELVCAVLAHHGITATLAEDVQNAIRSMESHINAFLLGCVHIRASTTNAK